MDDEESQLCRNCGANIFSEQVCPSCGNIIATNENIRDKKIQEYEKQLLEDPKNIEILVKKANLHARKEDEIEEIKCFIKVLEINPKHIEATLRIGIAFAYLAHYSETLKEGVREDLKTAGIPFTDPQLYEDAASYYDKVLEIEPNQFDALYHKGRLYAMMDEDEDALVFFDKALQIDSQNASLLFDIAHLHYLTPDYGESIKWLEKVLEIKPEEKQALDLIIYSLYFKQRFGDVVHYCDKLLKIDPDDITAKDHKKHALEAMSNK